MHIWIGKFGSEEEFEKYLDQEKYLAAWAVYDNEPPTGNEEEDAEPSQELRCDFCKEVDLDTYDEDFMIMKYYKKSVDTKTIAQDVLADEDELESLFKQFEIGDFNSVIVYEDNDLSEQEAAGSLRVKYVGKLQLAPDIN